MRRLQKRRFNVLAGEQREHNHGHPEKRYSTLSVNQLRRLDGFQLYLFRFDLLDFNDGFGFGVVCCCHHHLVGYGLHGDGYQYLDSDDGGFGWYGLHGHAPLSDSVAVFLVAATIFAWRSLPYSCRLWLRWSAGGLGELRLLFFDFAH